MKKLYKDFINEIGNKIVKIQNFQRSYLWILFSKSARIVQFNDNLSTFSVSGTNQGFQGKLKFC